MPLKPSNRRKSKIINCYVCSTPLNTNFIWPDNTPDELKLCVGCFEQMMSGKVLPKLVVQPMPAHFTDYPEHAQDRFIGDTIAETIGDLIAGWNMTPVWQWTRVARALRIHGLKIVEIDPKAERRICPKS